MLRQSNLSVLSWLFWCLPVWRAGSDRSQAWWELWAEQASLWLGSPAAGSLAPPLFSSLSPSLLPSFRPPAPPVSDAASMLKCSSARLTDQYKLEEFSVISWIYFIASVKHLYFKRTVFRHVFSIQNTGWVFYWPACILYILLDPIWGERSCLAEVWALPGLFQFMFWVQFIFNLILLTMMRKWSKSFQGECWGDEYLPLPSSPPPFLSFPSPSSWLWLWWREQLWIPAREQRC